MTCHELKTDSDVFRATLATFKPWEIRYNDRGFKPGDTVRLLETRYCSEAMKKGMPLEYTGVEIEGLIEYVLEGPVYGLKDGWCIFTVAVDQVIGEDK